MMTAEEFQAAARALGLTYPEIAGLMGVELSGPKRWGTGRARVPGAVAILLRLMLAGQIARADVERAAGGVPA